MERDAHYQQKLAEARLRERLTEIQEELDDEQVFRNCAATHDYQYRMSEARTKALKQERIELQEILGDL